jgi:integrase
MAVREFILKIGLTCVMSFDEMVKHLPDWLKGFAKFAYYSGWRRGEVRSLQWADVELAAKVIRLRPEHSKIREPRMLALEGELWNVMAEQGASREYENPDETIGVSATCSTAKASPSKTSASLGTPRARAPR